jgi:hypothetical protein
MLGSGTCREDIIDLGHPLVRLAGEIDWRYLDRRCSSVCTPGDGGRRCQLGWWRGC